MYIFFEYCDLGRDSNATSSDNRVEVLSSPAPTASSTVGNSAELALAVDIVELDEARTRANLRRQLMNEELDRRVRNIKRELF